MFIEYFLMAILYLMVVNLISGFFFRRDARALHSRGQYAINERWLLFLALFGGSYSAWRVMRLFNYRRHASRFKSNFNMIVIAQITVLILGTLYLGDRLGWWQPLIAWGQVEWIELKRNWGF